MRKYFYTWYWTACPGTSQQSFGRFSCGYWLVCKLYMTLIHNVLIKCRGHTLFQCQPFRPAYQILEANIFFRTIPLIQKLWCIVALHNVNIISCIKVISIILSILLMEYTSTCTFSLAHRERSKTKYWWVKRGVWEPRLSIGPSLMYLYFASKICFLPPQQTKAIIL